MSPTWISKRRSVTERSEVARHEAHASRELHDEFLGCLVIRGEEGVGGASPLNPKVRFLHPGVAMHPYSALAKKLVPSVGSRPAIGLLFSSSGELREI